MEDEEKTTYRLRKREEVMEREKGRDVRVREEGMKLTKKRRSMEKKGEERG